ncbi:MAG: YbbR-like domain-containing protein [Bacteroidales bacterium]|nr:YbbR-like domain-containing protein [Bacteroidales bacterium]MBS3773909.1 YbbR-like domain-containing protein [Bacteroidales bacterium]
MKFNFQELATFFKNFKASKYREELSVFLVFLIISTVLWFLNELEDDYVTGIRYPVQYDDFPEDKILVGDLPSALQLKVRGQGFQILEYKLARNLSPLMLQVDSYDLKSQGRESSLKYYIPTGSIRSRITQQLSPNMEVLEIVPDTLFFEFTERTSKVVAVEGDIQYSFDKQMMLKSNVSIEPDSIKVSGPRSVLDTVNNVRTQYREFSDLTSTLETKVDLHKVHEQVEYSTDQVNLRIPVEQFTEGSLKKDISVRNCPPSLVVRTFPSSVKITYLVGLSNYDEVIPELFKVYVDYEEVRKGREQLKVVVENAPDYLRSYSYTPQEVDYIVERKDD